jgi:hypothetical protein
MLSAKKKEKGINRLSPQNKKEPRWSVRLFFGLFWTARNVKIQRRPSG